MVNPIMIDADASNLRPGGHDSWISFALEFSCMYC